MKSIKKRLIYIFLLYTYSTGANNINHCNIASYSHSIQECDKYTNKITNKGKSKVKENIVTSLTTLLDKTKKLFVSKKDRDRNVSDVKKNPLHAKKKSLHAKKKSLYAKKKSLQNGSYRVVRGDTFRNIAKKFSVSMHKILLLNHMVKGSLLKVGQKLKIPLSPAKVKTMQRYVSRFKQNKLSKHSLRVTATAYSSESGQTDSTPFIAAWNNRLKPGMKIIAVSRDLLHTHGLRNGTKVRISGLSGYYTVRDKMNKRFKKRIDIYKGINTQSALQWGKKNVVIYY